MAVSRRISKPPAWDIVLAAGIMLTESFAAARDQAGGESIIDAGASLPFPTWIVLFAGSAALLWRRQRPIVVLGIVVGAYVAWHLLGYPGAPSLAFLVAMYGIGRYVAELRMSAVAAAAAASAVALSAIADGDSIADIALGATVIPMLPWYVGRRVAARHERLRLLEDRAELLERERAAELRQVVEEERRSIARELHDVVAHRVSLMTVQAGAAQSILDVDPGRAARAMRAVEDAGRAALDELRHLLDVLGPRSGDQLRTPRASLADLAKVAEQMEAAGLPVELDVEGVTDELPTRVDLSAFRIVQESLTNSLRHAGPGARASVTVVADGDQLDIEVVDDGVGGPSWSGGSGRGLAGMRERAEAEEQLPTDRSLALLLAVEASALDQSDATRASLLETLGGDAQPFTRTVIPTPAAGYISLAVSPDGSTAIGKRNGGPIDIVDLDSRTVTAGGLEAPPSLSAGIDISDDGRLVVVSGDAKATGGTAAIVYRIADGTEVLRVERPVADVPGRDFGYLYQAVFAPGSGEIVMSEPDGGISVLDANTGDVLETVETGAPEIIALDVDGRVAYISYLTFSETGTTSLLSAWDIDTGESIAEATELEGFVVRVVSDGGRVAVAGDVSVEVFDSTTLEPVGDPFADPRGGGAFTGLATSPFGLLAVGSPVDLQVWVTGDGSSPPFKLEIEGQASGVAFAPDVSVLVTADPDGNLSTWRMGHVDDLGTPLVPEGPGLVTLSPEGDLVAVWARGRGVQLFDRQSLEHVAGLEGLGEGDNFLGLAFDPTGGTIAVLTCAVGDGGAFEQTGSCEAGLSLYDIESTERIAGPVAVGQVDGDIGAGAAFTADGVRIVIALATGRVGMYDASDLTPVEDRLQLPEISEGPDDWSMAIATGRRDGRDLLAILNSVSLVAVWDITDEPILIDGIETSSNAIGFTPDGELVVGFVNGPVQIYDPLTVEPIGAPFPSTVPAWSFAQSETGVLVVNGLFGGTRLWDMKTRQPLSGALPGFASGIDPDGSRLFLGALGDGDGGTRVAALPLDLESLVAAACEQAGRNLTTEEWFRYMPAGSELRATCPDWPLPESTSPTP